MGQKSPVRGSSGKKPSKKNFSSKFLHGTPYSNANFSPREFQANWSVTVKLLSLLVFKKKKTFERFI